MKIIIAGASGLVGRALARALQGGGHEIRRLVRGSGARAADEISWDPGRGLLDATQLAGVDALINLAGENIANGRWTAARRQQILQSRVDATRTLVLAIGKMVRRPAVLLNASAVGYYGDRGDEVLTEASTGGSGFLPDVCRAWEEQAQGAQQWGVRTVLTRFGLILSREGGALGKMLPLFRSGLGGRMGSGAQWMSWISLDDVVGAMEHALHDVRCTGPMNLVAPAPVTNAAFAAELGRLLHRPAVLPAPAWALRLAVGSRMADEALLGSQRASPQRLDDAGYVFLQPTLELALRGILAWRE